MGKEISIIHLVWDIFFPDHIEAFIYKISFVSGRRILFDRIHLPLSREKHEEKPENLGLKFCSVLKWLISQLTEYKKAEWSLDITIMDCTSAIFKERKC